MENPTVAEMTATGAVNISCYLTPGGFDLTSDQASIDDQRDCSTDNFALPGRATFTLTITGIDNTNTAIETTYNALVDALQEGAVLYDVTRRGKRFDIAPTADDKVRVVQFIVGKKSDLPSEANSVQRSSWQCFVSAAVIPDTVGKIATA
jgi:hypothetical protein